MRSTKLVGTIRVTKKMIHIDNGDYFPESKSYLNLISTLTFLTFSTALTTLLLLPAAADLSHRAVRHSVTHLRLVQAGLLVPAKEGRGMAVNGSRAVPLVPRLRLRRQLRAVRRPVALLHLADPVPAAWADNLGVCATTRRLRQWFWQLNKSAG